MNWRMALIGLLSVAILGCSGAAEAGGQPTPPVPPTSAPTPTPSPTPEPIAVTLVERTLVVATNKTASVSIETVPGADCSIDVQYESGSSEAKGLDPAVADTEGRITWSWRVGSNSAPGEVPIVIRCQLGDRPGTLETSFTVEA